MNNMLRDGEKPEIIKIMPSGRNFGKTVALAIMLALSGCREKNLDPEAFPAEQTYQIDEENVEILTTTQTDHPDYEVVTENGAKTIVIKTDGEIYIRTTANSAGHSKSFIGSYDDTDTLEYEMPEGTFVIKSFDKK